MFAVDEDMLRSGLPYFGEPLNTKTEDPPERRPQLLAKFNCEIFTLDTPEERENFSNKASEVKNLCLHNRAESFPIEKQWDSDLKTWKVLLTWIEYFVTSPEGANNVLKNIQSVSDAVSKLRLDTRGDSVEQRILPAFSD